MLVEGLDEEIPTENEEETTSEDQELEMKSFHISFNSLRGSTSNKSLKVLGKLGGADVVILIDMVPPATSFLNLWLEN